MVYHCHKNLRYSSQETGDTVCFPARTVHFKLSLTADGGWNCPFSHKNLRNEEEAKEMERKAFNRYSDQRNRTKPGNRGKLSGVARKGFTVRRRVKSS